MQLCPNNTSCRGNPRHPYKACKFSSVLMGKAYKAAGHAASTLHATALQQVYQAKALKELHEGNADLELLQQVRTPTDLALRATKVTACTLGQTMSTLVVQERHLWLKLAPHTQTPPQATMPSRSRLCAPHTQTPLRVVMKPSESNPCSTWRAQRT